MRGIRLSDLLKEALESRQMRINEVSMEQLRSQFVDSGKISEEDFQEIEDASNGKSAYATWLATRVVGTKKVPAIIKQEDVYKFSNFFNVFDKKKARFPKKDLFQIKTERDLNEFIRTAIQLADEDIEVDPSQEMNSAQGQLSDVEIKALEDEGIEYLGTVDKYQVFKIPKGIKSMDAYRAYDKYLGRCRLPDGSIGTAHGTNAKITICTFKDKQFFEYTDRDDLYVFFNLSDPNSPYQFHYQSNQFMDKNDAPLI